MALLHLLIHISNGWQFYILLHHGCIISLCHAEALETIIYKRPPHSCRAWHKRPTLENNAHLLEIETYVISALRQKLFGVRSLPTIHSTWRVSSTLGSLQNDTGKWGCTTSCLIYHRDENPRNSSHRTFKEAVKQKTRSMKSTKH